MPPTRLALALLCVSVLTGVGGAVLVVRALAIPAPAEPNLRRLSGTVVEIVTTECGTGNRRGTCYRPVLAFEDGGKPMQVVSRTAYRQKPFEKGAGVPVVIDADGTAWMAPEWETLQADRQRAYNAARSFPFIVGLIVLGCAGFGVLLGIGLLFFRDRRGGPVQGPPSTT